jgi:tetratricopeptide (TPR) repeat protein
MSSANTVTLNLLLVVGTFLFGCRKEDQSDRVEYTMPSGKKTSDVKDLKDGALTYQISGGGQTVPEKAMELHRQARAKGESGDYGAAIKLLRQASEIAPTWAYPYYDMAFTYLLQGDMTNALLNYRETDRLEPRGFFTAKTALWTLERENNGTFPEGTYLAYVSLEWTEGDKKREMIEQMTTNLPAFAPGWKERAWMASDTDKKLAFVDKALTLDPDPETYGICILNKAAYLKSAGKTTEAREIIEGLATNDSSTISTKALAKETLKTFTK